MTIPDFIRRFALHAFLPALVLSAILVQQTPPWLLLAGQVASITSVLLACTLLLLTFRQSAWPVLVVATVIGLRIMRFFAPHPMLDGAYTLAFFVLFALVGGILAAQAPRVLARQLYWLCALSLPLMLLQLLGVGAWTQVLRTDLNDLSNLVAVPTLGRWPGDVVINPLQARPAGFFSSNNTFSVFLVFAIAMTFAHSSPHRRRRWRDVVVSATVVVSMAKIALLAFLSVAAWRFVRGDGDVRLHAAKATATLVVLLTIYAALFPGVYAYNLSPQRILLNVQYRVTDFAAAVPIGAVREWAGRQSIDIVANLSRLTDKKDTSSSQSGYSDMAPALPVVFLAAILLAPHYRSGWRTLRTSRPELAWQSTCAVIVVVLTPIMTSYVLSTLFATMFGVAILPLLIADSGRWRSLPGEPNDPDPA
jgi:hypothetical protein